jgi:hypothetical protein
MRETRAIRFDFEPPVEYVRHQPDNRCGIDPHGEDLPQHLPNGGGIAAAGDLTNRRSVIEPGAHLRVLQQSLSGAAPAWGAIMS